MIHLVLGREKISNLQQPVSPTSWARPPSPPSSPSAVSSECPPSVRTKLQPNMQPPWLPQSVTSEFFRSHFSLNSFLQPRQRNIALCWRVPPSWAPDSATPSSGNHFPVCHFAAVSSASIIAALSVQTPGFRLTLAALSLLPTEQVDSVVPTLSWIRLAVVTMGVSGWPNEPPDGLTDRLCGLVSGLGRERKREVWLSNFWFWKYDWNFRAPVKTG